VHASGILILLIRKLNFHNTVKNCTIDASLQEAVMVFRICWPFQGLAHRLAQRMPRRQTRDKALRQSRQDLLQMSAHELKDLGISRSDIPALFEDPQAWHRDRP
jgi:uncharacterized protein YjiS (DUF1127 family)